MTKLSAFSAGLALIGSSLALGACATTQTAAEPVPVATVVATSKSDVSADQFERDRASILAMNGDYKVTFDFTETVAFGEGYELKEPKLSGGHEVVRVVEDTGDFISLQHLLVVGSDEDPFIVKHWRQDWQYQPDRVLVFIGGNAWEWRDVPAEKRNGVWSQTVYQVDDAPRYGAVAQWTYEDGVAEWEPDQEWRPLPRRDMTTRDDYHAINAVNRHVITPLGWVHEQDNSKLVLSGEPHVLVREVGVNTYQRFDEYPVSAADAYWAGTQDFWKGVRDEWAVIADGNTAFAITIKGETEALYNPLLDLALDVKDGEKELELALTEAKQVIRSFVTYDIGERKDRLRPSAASGEAY